MASNSQQSSLSLPCAEIQTWVSIPRKCSCFVTPDWLGMAESVPLVPRPQPWGWWLDDTSLHIHFLWLNKGECCCSWQRNPWNNVMMEAGCWLQKVVLSPLHGHACIFVYPCAQALMHTYTNTPPPTLTHTPLKNVIKNFKCFICRWTFEANKFALQPKLESVLESVFSVDQRSWYMPIKPSLPVCYWQFYYAYQWFRRGVCSSILCLSNGYY